MKSNGVDRSQGNYVDNMRMTMSKTAPGIFIGTKRETVDSGPLDHNNFMKKLVKSKKNKPDTKLDIISKQIGVRPFPGEILQAKSGPPKGAIYEADLIREMELVKSQNEQINTIVVSFIHRRAI